MRWIPTTLVMSCLLASMAPAYGQDQGKEQSRRHFRAAKRFEARKDYEAAARAYLEAYELYPSPEFFYNAGRAYHLHGNAAEAVEYYRLYLDLAPDGRASAWARAALAELGRSSAESRPGPETRDAHVSAQGTATETVDPSHTLRPAPEALPGTAPEAAPDTAPDTAPEALPERGDESTDERPVPRGDPAPAARDLPVNGSIAKRAGSTRVVVRDRARASHGRTARISGLVVGGAGLASISVGVLYGLEARRLARDIEGVRDQWTDAELSRYPAGRSAGTKAIVFAGAGAVALLGGGALYVWGARRAPEEPGQTRVAPLISSRIMGLSIAGVF